MAQTSKKRRYRDEDYLESIRAIPCVATGRAPPSDAHHVKSRGAGGGDDYWNVIPLSRAAHQELHKIGTKKFAAKYPWVKQYLECLGWEFVGPKIFNPKNNG